MGMTKLLSDQLQSSNLELTSATDFVVSAMDTLKQFRSDSTWDHTFKYITDVAALHDIEVEEERQRSSKQR